MANPGFVYEIDLSSMATFPPLRDPIEQISKGFNGSFAHSHNGSGSLIAEIAQGATVFSQAQQSGGGMLAPAVSSQLRALIFAIRDAEILVEGQIPSGAVVKRHDVF